MLFIGKMIGWAGDLQGRCIVLGDHDVSEDDHYGLCEGKKVFIKNPSGGHSLCRVVAFLPGEITDKISACP